MTISALKIGHLFEVKSGDYHSTAELDEGAVPLISCGDINNGLVGYYDIPPEMTYQNCITVAYNGSWPLTSKFHPYRFGAKDDVAVLLPRTAMSDAAKLYVAAMLNAQVWRYSYGRKCFREKLSNLSVQVPTVREGENVSIDERVITHLFPVDYKKLLPKVLSLFNPSSDTKSQKRDSKEAEDMLF